TVTSGLSVWNAATQASCAAPCDDAPPPTSVPERVLPDASAGVVASFAAHEASARDPAMAMAAMLPRRCAVMFTGFLPGMWLAVEAGACLVAHGRKPRCRHGRPRVNGRLTARHCSGGGGSADEGYRFFGLRAQFG